MAFDTYCHLISFFAHNKRSIKLRDFTFVMDENFHDEEVWGSGETHRKRLLHEQDAKCTHPQFKCHHLLRIEIAIFVYASIQISMAVAIHAMSTRVIANYFHTQYRK